MTINFKQIPANLRIPLFFAELDPSKANTNQNNQRTLIIGQVTSGGAAAPNVPLLSTGPGDAITQGGPGSMLALMTAVYRKSDVFGEVWYLPLADAGGAAAATGSIAFAGPATAAGVLSLYIAATKTVIPSLQLAVASGTTATALATAVVAAINAAVNLPVTAAVDGTNAYQVNLTAKNKGLCGNDIDIRLNYATSAGGESTPAGIVPTIVAMSGGATNPTLTTALANLADKAFDFIVSPYTDSGSVTALSSFMNDSAGRWNWSRQIYGHVFTALRGNASALTTFGLTMNDQHTSVLGFYDSPTPNWLWAADYAGQVAVSLRADPGIPLHGLALSEALAPPVASRFTGSTRNTMLFDGISTFTVVAGVVITEGIITTYQLNSQAQPDNSYLAVETMFSLMFLLRDLSGFVTSNYGRTKLAANGSKAAPGTGVVTPNVIRGSLIARYQTLEIEGYAQQSEVFAAGLTVQINPNNSSRVDVLYDPVLMEQLNVFAALVQFRLA